MIFYEELDRECRFLVHSLNDLPGIETFSSCCGHEKEPYRIWFRAKNTADLFPIIRAIDRRYCGHMWNWKIEVDLLDVDPFVVYVLTSVVDSSSEVYQQANRICDNITNCKWKLEQAIVAR